MAGNMEKAINPTAEKPLVLIYRDKLLNRSETFIKEQSDAITRHDIHFIGTRAVKQGLSLPETKIHVINKGCWGGLAREAAFKIAGLDFGAFGPVAAMKPSLVHAHFGPDGLYALALAKKLNVPLMVTFHGYDATDDFGAISLDRLRPARLQNTIAYQHYYRNIDRLRRGAAVFLAVSDFIRERLIDLGFEEDRIIRHYIGVDLDKFRADPAAPREPVVLFVGRLAEVKGLEYLIRAMADVQKSRPDAKLVVIGDGPLRGYLETMAKNELGAYTFLGYQPPDEVRRWMNRAKVFSVPSVRASTGSMEGFGLVFIEAAAMGTPAAGFSTGGIPEAVAHERTGLLAPARDWETLGQYILRLLDDDGLWKKMSEECRKRAEKMFDIKKQTKILEDIYTDVINGRTPAFQSMQSYRRREQDEQKNQTITKVAVCIATQRRPGHLRRLLKSLAALKIEHQGGVEVKVAVADNDPEGSARSVVEEVRAEGFPFPIDYAIEARRGISEARNLSVKLAGAVDSIAFIDDDETARPDWLKELLRAARNYGAQVVSGPVQPNFEKEPEPWMVESGLFGQPVFKTGHSPRWAGTGNLLVQKSLLDELDGPFDPFFSITGGGDQHLFRRLKNLGARNIYTRKAIVQEFKPAENTTMSKILRRRFRQGAAWTMVEKKVAAPFSWIARSAIFGAGLICLGALISLSAIMRGRGVLLRAVGKIVFGAGMISGMFGFWVRKRSWNRGEVSK